MAMGLAGNSYSEISAAVHAAEECFIAEVLRAMLGRGKDGEEFKNRRL